jgi:hypothetical protein
VNVESEAASGVLSSHGGRFGGHTLYVKDRRLRYVYNLVGSKEQMVESTKEIPTGTLSLFIDDEKVGEGQIMTQPGNFSLVGEGLNVGRDPAEPVTDDYPGTSPFSFSGGTIKQAVVDISGEHFVDLEMEALAMMKRE